MTASPPDLSALLPIIAKARDLDGPRKFVRGQLEDLLEVSRPDRGQRWLEWHVEE